jgi:magnesium-transporting ATPase (P-type)
MAKDFYGVGISVLSIVFSIFFAALAIVMSAGDNEFIAFLHKEGAYTEIVWNFRFAVMVLFTSLIVTLAEYVYVGFRSSHSAEWHSKWFLVIFFFCFSYSLLAVCLAILDAIKYSSNRVKFLNSKMH